MPSAENNMVFGRFPSVVMQTLPRTAHRPSELLAFERMLADLSARFANVPAEKVELEIPHGAGSSFGSFWDSIAAPLLNSRMTARLSFCPRPLSRVSMRRRWVRFPRNFPGLLPGFAPARCSGAKPCR